MENIKITKQNGNIRKSKICGIYCISNSKYFYIGQSVNIKSRWQSHKSSLKSGKHHNKFFQRVYNKYNEVDPFIYEIVLECNSWDLSFLESETLLHYIKKYKYKQALNLEDPLNTNCSEETRKRKSEAHKGKKLSPEQCRKISEKQLGISRPQQRIKIVQLDLEGNLIKIWDGIISAGKELGIKIQLSRQTSGGFQWQKYSDWKINPKGKLEKENEQKVAQYNQNNELIAVYDSITKASIATNIKHCNISNNINGIQKSAGGFIWKKL